MAFEIIIDVRAENEIATAIDYLAAEGGKSVANKFYNRIEACLKLLAANPFFQIRYHDIRCLPVKGFPYMFHFSIDAEKKSVFIHALIHTSQHPAAWISKSK